MLARTGRRLASLGCALGIMFGLVVATPAGAATVSGLLSITNPEVFPGNSSFIMNRIQNPADSFERVHDKVSVHLSNSGFYPLTISSLTTTGPFTAAPPAVLPIVLKSGQSIDVPVTFTANYGAWFTGSLVVNSTSSSGSSIAVKLAGYWQRYSENNLEPTLSDLVKYLGFSTAMPASSYSRGAYQAFSADEVLSPYWTRLDSSKPSKLTQLAGWRGYPGGNSFQTYPKGSSASRTTVFTGLRTDAQSLLPRASSYQPGTATFSTAGTFGLALDGEFSDPSLNPQAHDRAGGCTATLCGHWVRVFRARNSGGLIPGTYIVVDDLNGVNYDYQDSVYLVTNLKPAA